MLVSLTLLIRRLAYEPDVLMTVCLFDLQTLNEADYCDLSWLRRSWKKDSVRQPALFPCRCVCVETVRLALTTVEELLGVQLLPRNSNAETCCVMVAADPLILILHPAVTALLDLVEMDQALS